MVHSEPIAQSWSVQNKSLQREAELSKMCNRSRPEPISQTGTQGRQMAKRSRCYRLTCAAYKLLQGSWPVCGSGPPELAARNDGGLPTARRCAPRNDAAVTHCGPALSSRPCAVIAPPPCHREARSDPLRPRHKDMDCRGAARLAMTDRSSLRLGAVIAPLHRHRGPALSSRGTKRSIGRGTKTWIAAALRASQ
jgi:hypothetical protein